MSDSASSITRDQKLLNQLLQETFASNDWFSKAVELGANPVFLGFGLTDRINDVDGPNELAVMSMEWSGGLASEELLKSLRPAERFDEKLGLYSPKGSKITLNIWESFKRDDATMVTSLDKLFRHEENTLKTAVLYYNNGKGHYEEFEVKHELPWEERYTVDLTLCRKKDDMKSLDWDFCLYKGKRSVDGWSSPSLER